MDGFAVKCILADFLDRVGILDRELKRLNRKYANNYIRIVNYHTSPEAERHLFQNQVEWFLERFENCDMEKMASFLRGESVFREKPGIIFTFDDGFLENYQVAHQVLKEQNATGWYMVSSGFVGQQNHQSHNGCHDYMTAEQLRTILADGGVIGCHTYSHHRMDINDTEEILFHEIVEAKSQLQKLTGTEINLFCWCGGEEETYTQKAAELIRSAGYTYAFMTNSEVIRPDTNRFQMDRSNIEASWPISLVKFQICGLMDYRFSGKRRRVHKLTGEIDDEKSN